MQFLRCKRFLHFHSIGCFCSLGVEALSQQLVVMGIRSLATNLDPTSNIVKAALIDMYVEIGDHISLQYGGSEAHKKVQSSGAAVAIQVPTTGKVGILQMTFP